MVGAEGNGRRRHRVVSMFGPRGGSAPRRSPTRRPSTGSTDGTISLRHDSGAVRVTARPRGQSPAVGDRCATVAGRRNRIELAAVGVAAVAALPLSLGPGSYFATLHIEADGVAARTLDVPVTLDLGEPVDLARSDIPAAILLSPRGTTIKIVLRHGDGTPVRGYSSVWIDLSGVTGLVDCGAVERTDRVRPAAPLRGTGPFDSRSAAPGVRAEERCSARWTGSPGSCGSLASTTTATAESP